MAPEPFETVRLHPIGLNGSGADPLAGQTGKKVLAISPFLGASRLRQIAETAPRARQRHLISLPLEMERLGGKALEPFGNLWRLHDEAGSNNEDDPSAEAGHGSGLHAKAYVIDREDGKKTTWFVGSPNATMSAFERNVEMLVELDGPSRKAGVNRILEEAGGEGVSFRSLLREFSPSGEEPIPDPLAEDEYRLEEIAREIAEKGVGLEARQDGRRWKVKLTLGSRPSGLLKADRLRARLATAGGRSGSGVRFTEVRPDERPSSTLTAARASAVTALIEFRLSSGARPKAPDRTFIVLGNLTGAPDDRRELLLLDLVEDEKRFRRLLFLLLASSDPGTDSASEARKFISATGTGDGGFPAEQGIPLFESLVRSYARDPERLRAVAGIVEQFQATEEGRKRLPEGFEDMWKAFAPEADK